MENFLVVDTSCKYLSVVACKDGQTFSCFVPDCAMRHSTTLMEKIEETLTKANLTLDTCDFFGAVVGAGSFTGIRIGISAIKGFCLASGKPALPITSFEVSAYNAIEKTQGGGKILSLVDALHGYYYACGFEKGEIVYPPAYLSEEEVLALAKAGYTLCSCEKLAIAEKHPVVECDAVDGLAFATRALAKKGKFGELTALYIRKSSAELNAGR